MNRKNLKDLIKYFIHGCLISLMFPIAPILISFCSQQLLWIGSVINQWWQPLWQVVIFPFLSQFLSQQLIIILFIILIIIGAFFFEPIIAALWVIGYVIASIAFVIIVLMWLAPAFPLGILNLLLAYLLWPSTRLEEVDDAIDFVFKYPHHVFIQGVAIYAALFGLYSLILIQAMNLNLFDSIESTILTSVSMSLLVGLLSRGAAMASKSLVEHEEPIFPSSQWG